MVADTMSGEQAQNDPPNRTHPREQDDEFETVFSWQEYDDDSEEDVSLAEAETESDDLDFFSGSDSDDDSNLPQPVPIPAFPSNVELSAIPPHVWGYETPDRGFEPICPFFRLPNFLVFLWPRSPTSADRLKFERIGIRVELKKMTEPELRLILDARLQPHRCKPSNLRYSWTVE